MPVVTIKTLSGQASEVTCAANEVIADIKVAAVRAFGYSPGTVVRVFYLGKELEDDQTLASYSILGNLKYTLHVLVPPAGSVVTASSSSSSTSEAPRAAAAMAPAASTVSAGDTSVAVMAQAAPGAASKVGSLPPAARPSLAGPDAAAAPPSGTIGTVASSEGSATGAKDAGVPEATAKLPLKGPTPYALLPPTSSLSSTMVDTGSNSTGAASTLVLQLRASLSMALAERDGARQQVSTLRDRVQVLEDEKAALQAQLHVIAQIASQAATGPS